MEQHCVVMQFRVNLDNKNCNHCFISERWNSRKLVLLEESRPENMMTVKPERDINRGCIIQYSNELLEYNGVVLKEKLRGRTVRQPVVASRDESGSFLFLGFLVLVFILVNLIEKYKQVLQVGLHIKQKRKNEMIFWFEIGLVAIVGTAANGSKGLNST